MNSGKFLSTFGRGRRHNRNNNNHYYNNHHHRKWNNSYLPFYDYSDTLEAGVTMQPKTLTTKTAMAANVSEMLPGKNGALTQRELTQSAEVAQTMNTSNSSHYRASMIAVLVIMSIFLVITMTTTSLLIAFCRKKNAVFALQKCEQQDDDDDSEYELDDIEQTDIEMLKEESGRKNEVKPRSNTYPNLSRVAKVSAAAYRRTDSPTNQPLMYDSATHFVIESTDDDVDIDDDDRKNLMMCMPRSKTFSVYYDRAKIVNKMDVVRDEVSQLKGFFDRSAVVYRNPHASKSSLSEDSISSKTKDESKCVPKPKEKNNSQKRKPNKTSSTRTRTATEFKTSGHGFVTDCDKRKQTDRRTDKGYFKLQTINTNCTTTDSSNEQFAGVSESDLTRQFQDLVLVNMCSGSCAEGSTGSTAMFAKSKEDNSNVAADSSEDSLKDSKEIRW